MASNASTVRRAWWQSKPFQALIGGVLLNVGMVLKGELEPDKAALAIAGMVIAYLFAHANEHRSYAIAEKVKNGG